MFDFARRKTRPAPARDFVFVPQLDRFEDRLNPVPVGIPDTYSVGKGSVLTQGVSSGVLANDFDDADSGAVLNSILRVGPRYTNPGSPPLPLITLTLNPNGSFTFIAPSNFQPTFGNVTFTYVAFNADTGKQSQETTVTVNITGAVGGAKFFATGSGTGMPSQVRVFDAQTGSEKYTFNPYEPGFLGGVRTNTGDLNGDGVDDIVVAPANGGGARIQVYDGKFGNLVEDFFAFEPSFRGGADVAIGQIDGLNGNDLIVGAGEGGGPRVLVFDGQFVQNLNSPNPLLPPLGTTPPILNFFAYESTFRNGVRVTAGDVGDDTGVPTQVSSTPRDFIVTGPGFGGGPVVKVFDGIQAKNQGTIGIANPAPVRSFFAFDPASRGGATVAVGQFRGDGLGDIVAGQGTGDPLVRVFDGRSTSILRQFQVQTSEAPFGGGGSSNNGNNSSSLFGQPAGGGSTSLLTTGSNTTGGARVAVADRVSGTNDRRAISEIVASAGFGNAPRVHIYDGNSLAEVNNFIAYPSNFLGGVFVGGNSL